MTRTETDLNNWQQQQARFQKIFGNEATMDKSFQKVKLKELEKIYQRNKKTSDPVEKATLQWLKAGNKSIERQLYPRFRQRLLRRLVATFRRPIAGKPKQSLKPKEVPANRAAKSWVEQHVNNTTQKRPGRKIQAKANHRRLTKSPRVRVPKIQDDTLRISR